MYVVSIIPSICFQRPTKLEYRIDIEVRSLLTNRGECKPKLIDEIGQNADTK